MNDNFSGSISMSNKKSDEYRSLGAAKEKLPFLKSLTDISQPNQERPDFIFVDKAGNKIGIEHFRIDISMGSRRNSGVKITQGDTKKIFNKYHRNIREHLGEARQEIEAVLNRTMREWQNFDYQVFCARFKEILEDHYLEVEKYKAGWGLSKIGFLIEFLVPGAEYIVSVEGGEPHIQELCDFPITTAIWQILHDALEKLDFIILDTNQYLKKKDSIVLIDKEKEPQRIFEEFSLPSKGRKSKVNFEITN